MQILLSKACVRRSATTDPMAVLKAAHRGSGKPGEHHHVASMPSEYGEVPFGFTSWAQRPLGIMVLGLAYRNGAARNESNWSNKEFDAALLAEAEGYLDVEGQAREHRARRRPGGRRQGCQLFVMCVYQHVICIH